MIKSVTAFRRACGCSKLQQISELRLTKGMGLVRYEAKRILCEKIAEGETWEKIAEAVNALYESHREYGETEYQLSWQFDREKEFDLELYKKIYTYFTEDYIPRSGEGATVKANIVFNDTENELSQEAGLLFERSNGVAEAFVFEYENKWEVTPKARTEEKKVSSDLRLLVLAKEMSKVYKDIAVNLIFIKTGMDNSASEGALFVSSVFGYSVSPKGGTKDDNRMSLFFENTPYMSVIDGNFVYNTDAMDIKIKEMVEIFSADAGKAKNCARCPERDVCMIQSFSPEYWDATMSEKEGKQLPGEWNDDQKKAIENCYGKTAILASAGTGKTHTLMGVADKFLSDGIKPGKILMLAFSNKAVGEIKDRLSSKYDEIPVVSTIHSYALDVLTRYATRAYGYQPVPGGTRQQAEIILHCLEEHGGFISGISYKKTVLKDPKSSNSTVKKILSLYDIWLKLGIEGLDAYNAEHPKNPVNVNDLVSVFERYEELIVQGHYVTYDDMIRDVVKLFVENPDVLKTEKRQHPYVIVDEYQDVNNDEGRLIDLLCGDEGDNLVVVGDDDQCIYRFKGSNNTWLVDFAERHKGAKTFVLGINYRSTAQIVDSASKIIGEVEGPRISKKISTVKEGEVPCLKMAETRAKLPEVCAEIVRGLQEKGESLRDIAVLARSNADLQGIRQALGLPSHLNRALVIEDPLFITLFFLVKACVRGIKESERELYKALLVVDPVLTKSIPVRNGQTYESLLTYLRLPDVSDRAYYRNIPAEEYDRLEGMVESGYGYGYVLDLLRLYSELKEVSDKVGDTRNFVTTFKVLTEREGHLLLEFIEEKIDADPALEDISEMCAEMEAMVNFSDEARFDTATSDSVTLTTAHDSKGLQWKNVVIYDVDAYLAVNSKEVDEDKREDMDDARRLLYVAMTRAEQNLVLLGARDRGAKQAEENYIFTRELEGLLGAEEV